MENKEEFWKQVKDGLSSKNKNNRFLRTWFESTDLLSVENLSGQTQRIKLGVPTDLHKHWIDKNLFDRICSEISNLIKNPFELELVVVEDLQKKPENLTMLQKATAQPLKKDVGKTRVSSPVVHRDFLNPEYTFSSFIVGRNNEFAHASSYRIAQKPGSEGYNPLFICGPTGMGKTHLLQSVGNHVQESFPNTKIRYVSAERFLNEFVSGVRRGEMEKFRNRYREECGLLLIDDIQIIKKKEGVQEEFFHTLNSFFEKERQVVVAGDRMPRDIDGLEDRIRTRLEWGLVADIQMPDFETRLAILRYKAERKKMYLPDEVADYIAKISKRSIRELEGNLNKVKMFSEFRALKIDLSLTKEVLAAHGETSTLYLEDIQKIVSEHFKVRVADMKSKSRNKHILIPRQIAMYLIKNNLNKPFIEIGRAFGGKDHTTVMNAVRKIQRELDKNSDLKKDIQYLQSRIHNITGL